MNTNVVKSMPGIFGTISVAKDEQTGNPVHYALLDKLEKTIGVIKFQDGAPPVNGFCIEDVLNIARDRIVHLNSELPSDYNLVAIEAIDKALDALKKRLAERTA